MRRIATERERVQKEISKLPLSLEELTNNEDIRQNLCIQSLVKREGSSATDVNKANIKKP
jgi:hypothetical protein